MLLNESNEEFFLESFGEGDIIHVMTLVEKIEGAVLRTLYENNSGTEVFSEFMG